MDETKINVKIENEDVTAYVISKMNASRIYDVLKKEVSFEVMIDVIQMLNFDVKRSFLEN